jgi:hypothetical protein
MTADEGNIIEGAVNMEWMKRRRRSTEQAVEIQEKRFGYFPQAFRWHGKRYDVEAVERCWNAKRSEPHLCFRVRCRDGIFELYQNVRDNTWRLVSLGA